MRKGSSIADEIISEEKRKKYFQRLAKRINKNKNKQKEQKQGK